ncbi:RNA polymerase sigma factor SigM [compost metagenome]
MRDEQEAKDLVQAFFLEIWEKNIYMRLNGDIKGYLFRSVQNKCLNYIRQQETQSKRQEKLTDYLFNNNDTQQENGNTDRIYTKLDGALNDLSKQRKEALKLVYLQDKKYKEAADIMGISINSLKTHLKTGLKSLRETLNLF